MNLSLARLVGHVIQIALGIGYFIVNRRRKHLVSQSQNAGDKLGRPGGCDKMAGHALDTGDGNFGILAKDDLNGFRLDHIVFLGGCAVGWY